MRVLHVHSGNLYGGVETLLSTLARYASAAPEVQHQFAVCFPGKFEQALRESGAAVHLLGEVRLSRPWTVLRARSALRFVIEREAIDLVLAHSVWIQGLLGPVARLAARRTAVWLHDEPRGTHWTERLARRVVPDLVVCNSRFTQGLAGRLYPLERSVTVAPPVASPAVEQGARRAIREELGVAAERTVIVIASRFERLKGHDILIRALAGLRDLPEWECWVAGGAQRPAERQYLAELRELAARLGVATRLRFLGHRGDVARVLAASDIYCQPNVGAETFGIAFVEAMYASLPVVTTPVGAAPEIVDEECGRLVPPGDAPALGEALRGLVESPALRRRLGERGRDKARAVCDPVEQSARIAEVLCASVARAPVGALT